jgi:hypothetical protein
MKRFEMVGPNGFEPSTSSVSRKRSGPTELRAYTRTVLINSNGAQVIPAIFGQTSSAERVSLCFTRSAKQLRRSQPVTEFLEFRSWALPQ